MYGLKCPECGASLGAEADAATDRCPACGWAERRPPAVDSDTPAPAPPAKKRKRRRQSEAAEGPQGRSFPWSGYAVGMGVLLVAWAALAGLSYVVSLAAICLLLLGVGTALVGTAWVMSAAIKDGLSPMALTSRSMIVMAILVVIQVLAVPALSLYHNLTNFEDAWRPALVLWAGVGMTASGFYLMR